MKYRIIIILFVISLSWTKSYSQAAANDFNGIPKNNVSFNFFGATPLVGITYERLLSKKLSVEIGIGSPAIGAGIKFFPSGVRIQKVLFHTGLTFSASPFLGPSGYLPVGISYFAKKRFNVGIDLGPGYTPDSFIPLLPYGNLKFGYRI